MRIVLVSIPLYFAPIFLAPGGGNGKPSKYLGASIYPRASGRRRERLEEERATSTRRNRDRDERGGKKGGRRVLTKNSSFALVPVRFRKATARGDEGTRA